MVPLDAIKYERECEKLEVKDKLEDAARAAQVQVSLHYFYSLKPLLLEYCKRKVLRPSSTVQ
jgi:hypothetical protein